MSTAGQLGSESRLLDRLAVKRKPDRWTVVTCVEFFVWSLRRSVVKDMRAVLFLCRCVSAVSVIISLVAHGAGKSRFSTGHVVCRGGEELCCAEPAGVGTWSFAMLWPVH